MEESTEPTLAPPIPYRGLTQDVFNSLMRYLDTKPHNEVRVLIDSLSSSILINVTATTPAI